MRQLNDSSGKGGGTISTVTIVVSVNIAGGDN